MNVKVIPDSLHFSAPLTPPTAWISTGRQPYFVVYQFVMCSALWEVFHNEVFANNFSCTFLQPVLSTFISESNFLYFPKCPLTNTQRSDRVCQSISKWKFTTEQQSGYTNARYIIKNCFLTRQRRSLTFWEMGLFASLPSMGKSILTSVPKRCSLHQKPVSFA